MSNDPIIPCQLIGSLLTKTRHQLLEMRNNLTGLAGNSTVYTTTCTACPRLTTTYISNPSSSAVRFVYCFSSSRCWLSSFFPSFVSRRAREWLLSGYLLHISFRRTASARWACLTCGRTWTRASLWTPRPRRPARPRRTFATTALPASPTRKGSPCRSQPATGRRGLSVALPFFIWVGCSSPSCELLHVLHSASLACPCPS